MAVYYRAESSYRSQGDIYVGKAFILECSNCFLLLKKCNLLLLRYPYYFSSKCTACNCLLLLLPIHILEYIEFFIFCSNSSQCLLLHFYNYRMQLLKNISGKFFYFNTHLILTDAAWKPYISRLPERFM